MSNMSENSQSRDFVQVNGALTEQKAELARQAVLNIAEVIEHVDA